VEKKQMEVLQSKWLKLWFLWIVAIAIGNSRMGDTISELLMSIIYVDYYSPLFILFIPLYFILNGGISGIAQWLVLRNYIDISGWLWTFTTILGSVISTYLLELGTGSGFAGFIIYSGIIGLLISCMQWLILRRRISRAGWWILILVTAQIISAVVVIVIVTLFKSTMVRTDILTSILYGAITGAGLVVLLMQPAEKNMSASRFA
jgi:hypothetical protein